MALGNDIASIWLWPYEMAKAQIAAIEIMVTAPTVVGARLPTIAQASIWPWMARTEELTRMVREKRDAAKLSGQALARAHRVVQDAMHGNARDLGRLSSGAPLWPADYWRMAERSLSAMAALTNVSGDMLAPVHRRVTSNARRLR